MKDSENKVYIDALMKWGEQSQRDIWVEELTELIQVLLRETRGRCTKEQVAEEIADVDLCLSQLKMLYPTWTEHRVKKMDRLKERLYGCSRKWFTEPYQSTQISDVPYMATWDSMQVCSKCGETMVFDNDWHMFCQECEPEREKIRLSSLHNRLRLWRKKK